MDYQQTLDFLFTKTAVFQHDGASAYKPGLERVEKLLSAFGNPHHNLIAIHVGGTNGKGSTAHTLAAVLQSAGYKVGLFTSPHLVDFRERIRVNGAMIPKDSVIDFVNRFRAMDFGDLQPSFFELTTAMAFEYFVGQHVDIAVIEVGLGGRLDSTNVVSPRLSIITNISKDHTQQLGDSLSQIAFEKAGIIKPGTPVVIGEADGDVRRVFVERATNLGAPIVFACDRSVARLVEVDTKGNHYVGTPFGDISGVLSGEYQARNAATIITALQVLKSQGWRITEKAVAQGFAQVDSMTGLAGRWMVVSQEPLTICDTGHNVGGWQYISARLGAYGKRLKMIVGFVNDKDISHILELMPRDATYYFTQASVNRALPAEELANMAKRAHLKGHPYPSVVDACEAALSEASVDDVIFIGGSNFVVGDFLSQVNQASS